MIKAAILTRLPRTRQVSFGIDSRRSPGSHLFLQKQFSCHDSKSYLGEQNGKIVSIFHAFTRRHLIMDACFGAEVMNQYSMHLRVWVIDLGPVEYAKFILQLSLLILSSR